jgi:subtilisin family serine protease
VSIKIILSILTLSASLMADFYYSGGKKHTITKLKNSRANNKSLTTYTTKNNTSMSITNNLIVAYKDLSVKKDIEYKYNLTQVKSFTKNMYLYKVKNSSSTLEISNSIYNEDGVKFSHPNFIRTKTPRVLTKDFYSYSMWHLKDDLHGNNADINIEEAWKYTKGKGVKVAVYDEGIDIDHPDLRENIYGFANFNSDDTNIPYSDGDKWHGTACAGILGAKENRIGGVGVAPEISMYAIRYSDNNTSKDIEAYLSLMNEDVSVITNSWGTYSSLDAYNETFKYLAQNGRNGKGIIIVFAAGNDSKDLDQPDKNGNAINDESESQYVISIAASTQDNSIARYSNFGSSIDFTAPGGSYESSRSGIFTTDATGSNGYTDIDYYKDFAGTSASAPMVAGVAALMLAKNPNLTRDEVVNILKKSATKLGQYDYDENGHNSHWGYGKVNAGKAVKIANSYGKSRLNSFARHMFETSK